MTRRLVVVGAGGFGRETLDVVEAINGSAKPLTFEVVGVVDDGPSEVNLMRLAERGVMFLGSVDGWLATGDRADYLIAIGNPQSRIRIAERFNSSDLRAATVVHPHARLGSMGSIGAGSIVCAGVQISTNVHLGLHVQVNPNATIGHDSFLSDFVSVNPAATISGECNIGCGVLIGAASVILQGLTVGIGSVIGAAACVVGDVESARVVKGVPAR